MNHHHTSIPRALLSAALLLLTLTWTGTAAAQVCFGKHCTRETCCNGTGICIGVDVCMCNDGYAGDDCSVATFCGSCTTSLCTDTSHGFCLGGTVSGNGPGGVCSSLPGWGGVCSDVAIGPTLTPATLDFGSVTMGISSTPPLVLTLTNPLPSVTISAITVAGTNPGDFTPGSGTCTTGGSLTAADSCTVPVTFTPTATGPRSATFTITTTSPAATLTTTLTGNGVGAIAADSIAVDTANPGTLYAGLSGAGIYKSTDSGATWIAATTQPANMRIKAVVIKPGDSTTLYAASYGGGVYKSIDSGVNWTVCANTNLTNLNVVSLVIDGSGKLYAGSETGVFVSDDNCATWTAINTGLPI